MKKIVVSVVNDLVTDQRIDRICNTLCNMGYKVVLVGFKKKNSLNLPSVKYKTKRFRLFIYKGFLFYLNYNIRLFFCLIHSKANILLSNDTDTLLANSLAKRLMRNILVFDAHEYFPGIPELNGRPIVKKIWQKIEKFGLPRTDLCYTVNNSVADLYSNDYNIKFHVIRNVPYRLSNVNIQDKSKLGLGEEIAIILYQGALNIDRGLEEAIMAMKLIKSKAILWIIGGGTIVNELKKLVVDESLANKVFFLGQMPFSQLSGYTRLANIGLCIEKPTNINYINSLPNKFFDYIQCQVPVLSSGMPEVQSVMKQFDIGLQIENHNPDHIAKMIDEMLADETRIRLWRSNLKKASEFYCWENEETRLIELFSNLLR